MQSSNSPEASSIEFTLEDTYEYLKDLQKERELEVQQLMNIIQNNEVKTISPNITPEEIHLKRLKFVESLSKLIKEEQPKDLPVINTLDFYTTVAKDLEKEVDAMSELNKLADEEIKDIQNDIKDLESKIFHFQEMKKCSFDLDSNIKNNYKAEIILLKNIFKEVKDDLANVVDELFPGNETFQELLSCLTLAYCKGGDDVYVDVEADSVDFITFLHSADIIQFHPHDSNKIKLMNM